MSIATQARRAACRQARMVAKARIQERQLEGGVARRVSQGRSDDKPSALEQLTQYIPTETVTLFIAAVSARAALHEQGVWTWLGPWKLIAIFTVITPAMLWLAALTTFIEEKRSQKLPDEATFSTPFFDMIAATLAFFIWSLAVPGLFEGIAALQIVAGFAAVAASWFLSRIAVIVGAS